MRTPEALLALDLQERYERAKALEAATYATFIRSRSYQAEREWERALERVDATLGLMAAKGVKPETEEP